MDQKGRKISKEQIRISKRGQIHRATSGREKETELQRGRETDRQRERQRGRESQKERQRERQ